MLTEAVIYNIIDQDAGKYVIRVPLFETIYSGSLLLNASSVFNNGIISHYDVGDTVWVGFEKNQADKPVILGKLTQEVIENSKKYKIAIQASSIDVDTSAKLPFDTSLVNSYSKYPTIKSIADEVEKVWVEFSKSNENYVANLETNSKKQYSLNGVSSDSYNFVVDANITTPLSTTNPVILFPNDKSQLKNVRKITEMNVVYTKKDTNGNIIEVSNQMDDLRVWFDSDFKAWFKGGTPLTNYNIFIQIKFIKTNSKDNN